MVRVKPYLFCLAIGCWLGATPGAIANPEPGWEPWRPNETEDDNWSFSAGFSNLELGATWTMNIPAPKPLQQQGKNPFLNIA